MIAIVAAASAAPVATWGLEDDDGGFVEDGELGQWAWGDVTNGPGAGWDGARAWSTGLTRSYLNDSTDTLEVPLPQVASLTRPVLRFRHWYELGAGDAAWVEVDGGNGWEVATPLYGYPDAAGFTDASGGWGEVLVDLRDRGANPRLRLVSYADPSGVADGWTVDGFELHDGDIAAPRLLELTELADTDDLDGPYVVEVTAEDDVAVTGATVWWSVGGVEIASPMSQRDGVWAGEIPGQAPDTTVGYRVVATDGVNEAGSPVSGTLSFRVRLPAPTALAAPAGRVVGTTVALSWTAPVTQHPVLGYDVFRDGELVASAESTSADVPITGEADAFAVRARYEAGEGDLSEAVVVDGDVPEVAGLDPAEAWPGETLRVTLDGAWLLLVDGDVTVGLGEDVTVRDVEVRDVDSASFTIEIGRGAEPGPRALTLATSQYTIEVADAFEVADGDDRPRLTGISPGEVHQGETDTLALTVVGELAGVPTVDAGEGVVVSGVEVDGDVLRFEVACANDAPIGEHAVRVDDGVRVFEGVSLTVRDTTRQQAGTCGTPSAAWLGVFGVIAVAGRRRA
ncbi:MAG: hypothetical protein ACOZNI_20670 [Myxococcota bacterium]